MRIFQYVSWTVIALLVFSFSCRKKDLPPENNTTPQTPKITGRYVITLGPANRVEGYKEYKDSILTEECQATYLNDKVIIDKKGDNYGYLDSVFLENGRPRFAKLISVYQHDSSTYYEQYFYDGDGRLAVIRDSIPPGWTNPGIDSFIYSFENGNLRTVAHGMCADYYYTGNKSALISVNNMFDNLYREKSKNLIEGVEYNYYCPGGPSWVYSHTGYEYVVKDSLITWQRIIDIGGHIASNTGVTPDTSIYTYEYIH